MSQTQDFDSNKQAKDAQAKGSRHIACESCRLKKLRCDPSDTPGVCVRCARDNLRCANPAPRGRSSKSYVTGLEERVRHLEDYLRTVVPGIDLDNLPRSDQVASASTPQPSPSENVRSSTSPGPSASSWDESTSPSNVSVEPQSIDKLTDDLDDLRFERYIGAGSMVQLVEAISKLRQSSSSFSESASDEKTGAALHWAPSITEQAIISEKQRLYHASPLPPQDLMDHLLDLYHRNVHPYKAIIHWPSFLRTLKSPPHLRDPSFRSLVFVVLAHASWFSDDPRVLPDASLCGEGRVEEAKGLQWLLAGISLSFRPFFPPASIYDLQFNALCLEYFWRTTSMVFTWSSVYFSIRRFVDAGAHRETTKRWSSSLMIDQLRKRAWWAVVVIDRSVSLSLGRPLSIQDNDFDVGPFLQMSDEDLERFDKNPHLDPLPPIRNNSQTYRLLVTFIFCFRLLEIATQVHGIVNQTRNALSLDGPMALREKHRAVVQIDSDMNEFLASLPPQLKWPPSPGHEEWVVQAAHVAALTCMVQMYTHVSQLADSVDSSLRARSMTICLSAARTSARVLEDLRIRGGLLQLPPLPSVAATAGLISFLPLLDPANAGRPVPQHLYDDVERCLRALEVMSSHSYSAKQFYEGLKTVAKILPDFQASSVGGAVPTAGPSSEGTPSTPTPPMQAPSARHKPYDMYGLLGQSQEAPMEGVGNSSNSPLAGPGPNLYPDNVATEPLRHEPMDYHSMRGGGDVAYQNPGGAYNLPEIPTFYNNLHTQYTQTSTLGQEMDPFTTNTVGGGGGAGQGLLVGQGNDFFSLWPLIALDPGMMNVETREN